MTPSPLTKTAPSASLLYITCGSRDEAAAIGRAVVAESLAACANIIDGMRSLYWWDGAVAEDAETVLLLKTTAANVPALSERVIALHSYDLPCVVEIPLGGGNPAFFEWIARETARENTGERS